MSTPGQELSSHDPPRPPRDEPVGTTMRETAEAEALDNVPDSKASDTKAPGVKTRVLIVEDDDEIRAALHDALDDLGYEALEEPDAERALVTLGRTYFDALLVDVRMPGMGGIALCRHLASDGPRVPVIVMTAFGDVDTAVEALRAGAFDFITKPISIPDVARVIERGIAENPRSFSMARLKEPAPEPTPPGDGAAEPAQVGAVAAGPAPGGAEPTTGEAASLEEVERRHIEVVLRAVGWNKARAARELGIDRSTLYRKLIRLGLTRPR
jgi:DNA-binding NtrC family response regulator